MKLTAKFIYQTLIYADLHDFAMKRNEIWQYLIGRHISYVRFTQELEWLVKSKKAYHRGEYYCLPKRTYLISRRTSQAAMQVKKLRYAYKAVRLLRCIPTLWFLGVSGSVAVGNADAQDDIDLFLICAPNTVWITRFFVLLLLMIIGRRRTPTTIDVDNTLCANMFMDARFLKLPVRERDIYSAHEIAQIQTLFSKHESKKHFLRSNAWVLKYLPHTRIPKEKLQYISAGPTWLRDLNMLFFYAQHWYMRRRITREVVAIDRIRFHPHDARSWVVPAFTARCKALGAI